jgi:hypothetical protein
MKNSNIIALNKQEEIDLLQSILKDGAQRMLAVHIPAQPEHSFRFNVNTNSGFS